MAEPAEPAKVALVTGAAGGIGSAVAAAFTNVGYAVVGVDRAPGADVEADLTRTEEAERAIRAALESHGRLDTVFNGAGISGRGLGDGPVHECDEDAWDAVLASNLKSVFLVCKHAVPALLDSGGGAIVNLASALALVGGDDDFATHAYTASKGGIVSLSRAIAVTYASRGIRCNVIAPGLIETPMSARAQSDPHIRARLPELQPLTGDFGKPSDVAAAALYLAQAEFVTGAVLTVDGGWTAR